MNSYYYYRYFDLGMFWLSSLLVFSGLGLFYSYTIRNFILSELLVVWFIACILLTEITLFDALRNQRLRKKAIFALLLHLIPILSLTVYWWWKFRSQAK